MLSTRQTDRPDIIQTVQTVFKMNVENQSMTGQSSSSSSSSSSASSSSASSSATSSSSSIAPIFDLPASTIVASLPSATTGVTAVIVESRAAFERKRKVAAAELINSASSKCVKYSKNDLIVDVRKYRFTEVPLSASRSWIWSHFKKIDVKVGSVEVLSWANTNAACNICCNLALTDSKIKLATPYTANHSPGHLERHLKSYHNDLLVDRREVAAAEEVTGRITITDYYQKHPEFEDLYLKWAVETYQPLNTIEGVLFRAINRLPSRSYLRHYPPCELCKRVCKI